jgi:hypothetical protein
MTLDYISKYGNIAAWIIAALAFYFTNQTSTALDNAKVSERVSVMEQQIHQEIIGYGVLQASIGVRLDRIERKVDCLIDKRLCN